MVLEKACWENVTKFLHEGACAMCVPRLPPVQFCSLSVYMYILLNPVANVLIC